jgi:hypothetical protein
VHARGTTRTIARLLAPDHDLGALAKGAAWVFHRIDGLLVEVEQLGPPTGTHELVTSCLFPVAAS